jgi:hypothetical protein
LVSILVLRCPKYCFASPYRLTLLMLESYYFKTMFYLQKFRCLFMLSVAFVLAGSYFNCFFSNNELKTLFVIKSTRICKLDIIIFVSLFCALPLKVRIPDYVFSSFFGLLQ